LLFKIGEPDWEEEVRPEHMIVDSRALRVRQDVIHHGKNMMRVHEINMDGMQVMRMS
jgi:hypothetical protein